MSFPSWLRSLKSSLELATRGNRRVKTSHRQARYRRLFMEILEDRIVPSPMLTVTNLAVNGSNGALVSNGGTWFDPTTGATVTLTASAGTVTQNSNGTWSWSETTPSGPPQTAPVTIYATDSLGATAPTPATMAVSIPPPAPGRAHCGKPSSMPTMPPPPADPT